MAILCPFATVVTLLMPEYASQTHGAVDVTQAGFALKRIAT